MKKLINLIIISSLLTGCIAVKKNNIPVISDNDLQFSSKKKPNVFIKINFQSSFYGQDKQNVVDNIKSAQKRLFKEVIKNSQCCNLVVDKEEADIVIDAVFVNESDSVGLVFAFITGFSFYTIPSWLDSKMKVSAKVKNKKMSKSYSFSDSVLVAQWLPFIFATPFYDNPFKSENNINRNLYKNLLSNMKKDGFIK